jgi:uncharacterized protein (DUF305 family)
MSSMPIENAAAAAAAANSGNQPAVDAAGQPVTAPPLPTVDELAQRVTAQQKAEAKLPQPTYTPSTSASFDSEAQKALTRAMSSYVKAQTRFIHNEKLPDFAGAMELHIISLTTALEQLGVL